MKWEATAPANIALIKYMGKSTPSAKNFSSFDLDSLQKEFLKKGSFSSLMKCNPSLNDSLSFTLNHFITKVEISELKTNHPGQDEWKPLKEKHLESKLSLKAQKRFLNFFSFLKEIFHIKGVYRLQSGNNFPHSAGLASSASSFAALTSATYKLARNKSFLLRDLPVADLARLSRLGSGSSCRSFFASWSLWEGKDILPVPFPKYDLMHQVLIIEKKEKKISSSEAHRRVLSSPLFKGRPQRANNRLTQFCQALNKNQWEKCYSIVWEEFLDMHQLFETSAPSFSYRTASVKKTLKWLADYWHQHKDGPLVTMDAGSSIHLLYRKDQKPLMRQIRNIFSHFLILSSEKPGKAYHS